MGPKRTSFAPLRYLWAPRKHTPKNQDRLPCLCARLPPAQVLLCPALADPKPKRRGRLVGNSDSAHPGLPRLQAQQSVGAPVPTQGLSALATLPAPHTQSCIQDLTHAGLSARPRYRPWALLPPRAPDLLSPGPQLLPSWPGPALPLPPPGGQQTLASVPTSGRKWMACPLPEMLGDIPTGLQKLGPPSFYPSLDIRRGCAHPQQPRRSPDSVGGTLTRPGGKRAWRTSAGDVGWHPPRTIWQPSR